MTEWEPIDTAPKDGTEIVAYGIAHGDWGYTPDMKHIYIVTWGGGKWQWTTGPRQRGRTDVMPYYFMKGKMNCQYCGKFAWIADIDEEVWGVWCKSCAPPSITRAIENRQYRLSGNKIEWTIFDAPAAGKEGG